ncbi:ABC-F family ATP-binding cassette domain-containing protein [Lentisphaerota bacterium ZTH]|nr:ABC-F family ATP-binding cassette domain-containing protein [Lentisphaerota bacterium]WET07109.1 ABC-F family ATP-binding cassette domain-containing protein [Lentisphaerota bacterium ZTH]
MAGDNVGRVIFSAESLSFNIGTQQLLDDTGLTVHDGERVALVGRNGCGKSTFLRMLAGQETPGQGSLIFARELRVNFLPQEFSLDETRSVYDNIFDGLKYFNGLLHKYENLPLNSPEHHRIEQELNRHSAWNPKSRMREIMTRLNVPEADRLCSSLSGGEKRRVALARSVVGEPDLLLLDEPTNHLDTETIGWIENFLAGYNGTCLFVTHDRYFLDRVATRVVELDNGKFYSYEGSYADFLEGKAAREAREDAAESKRRKFLRSEIDWVRRSPKARLRRNLGRLQRFYDAEAQSGPARAGEIDLVIPPASRLGNKTVELKNVSLAYENVTYIPKFDFEFQPGMKIGIVGRNGTGKTSLLKIITGELAPDSGMVEIAPTVEFNYIDQNRLKLNSEKTVFDEIGEGNDFVKLGNDKISTWSYLRRFMFEDERIRTQVKFLSGGEKARLIIAKILKNGGNFLILDEPTNDLDLSTLRLLEEALACYDGCVIVVSHDRYFLNRVCDGIIAFEGAGRVVYQVGDYDYYLEKRRQREKESTSAVEKPEKAKKAAPKAPTASKKLSYKLQRELDGIEERVLEAEARVEELENLFSDPEFFAKHGNKSNALQHELDAARKEVESLYSRWEELENLQG